MRVNLLDPGLTGQAGHHFDLDLKLARWIAGRGHETRVYAHSKVTGAVRDAFSSVATLEPLFRTDPYVHPYSQDRYAGELITYQGQWQLLSKDLENLQEADVWLWPTITASMLRACATIKTKAQVAGCVHAPAVSEEYPNGTIWWRAALLAAEGASLRLRLGTIEPEQRYEYLPLTTDGAFLLLPSYLEGVQAPAPRERLEKIGFFGHQRGEKGASLIPALVGPLVSSGYQLVVQDSSELVALQDRIGLSVMGFLPDLAEQIALCDLVVLPYQPLRYRRRGSGILMQALASGVPAVVPFDTAPGRLIDQTGAGTQFVDLQAGQVLTAIEQLRKDYPTIAMAAYEASLLWKARHGLQRFAKALIEGI